MTVSPIALEMLHPVGQDLARPECVLCDRDGVLHVSDWRGGVSRIYPDGGQDQVLGLAPYDWLRPNGIMLAAEGGYLVAHLGQDDGGVFHLAEDGQVRPLVTEVEGVPLPPTNYVGRDRLNRLWISVSTRHHPRAKADRRDVADGFVVLWDGSNPPRIVADGLGYTNECVVDPTGTWLYVNETFGRRLSRFPIAGNGDLGPKAIVATFGPGTFPDGLTFDVEGAVWVTSIVSNRILRITPDGAITAVLADENTDHVAWVEAAYEDGAMGRPHLDKAVGQRLTNVSSLAFGGPDRKTVWLGCLLGDTLMRFQSSVAGAEPAYW